MPSTTRRTVTKLLLVAPAALATAPLACQSTGGANAPERLTPEQRQQREEVSKSVSRMQESVARVAQMEIPVGSDPAIFFSPLVARK